MKRNSSLTLTLSVDQQAASAAYWTSQQQQQTNNPYVNSNMPAPTPKDAILRKFNSWGKKAETTANNVMHNLKTGPSVPEAAWDKLSLKAKAIKVGGFENLYKQTFSTFPYEKLNMTFACHLSAPTGPVSGTLFLSNVHLAFCSDRPFPLTTPSTQITWTHHKVMIPLAKIGAINPVVMNNSAERYIQVVTVEGHDFWFMGFVNFEKATQQLSESRGGFVASGVPLQY